MNEAIQKNGVTAATVIAQVVFMVLWPRLFGWSWTADELAWLTAGVALAMRALQWALARWDASKTLTVGVLLVGLGAAGNAEAALHTWPAEPVAVATSTPARAAAAPAALLPSDTSTGATTWWGPRAGVGLAAVDLTTGEALPGLALNACYGWSYRPAGLEVPTQVALGVDGCVGGGWTTDADGHQRGQVVAALVVRTVLLEAGVGLRSSFGAGGYRATPVLLLGLPLGLLEPLK